MKSSTTLYVFGVVYFSCFATAMMVGGWKSVSVDSPMVTKYADFAANEMSKSSNSVHGLKLIHIIKAQSQVVAGIKYRITMQMGSTECEKGTNSDQCEESKICTVDVWSREWMNKTVLTNSTCK